MKKLLKVSLTAMLVAAPFAANAADIADAGTVTATAVADVASTSYVKGAYNAAIGEINTNRAQINANTTAIAGKQAQLKNDAGTPADISATVKTAVAATGSAVDTALVTEKAVRDAIDNSNSAMDTRVDALETTVGDNTSGLVKDVADLKTTVGDSTSGLVKTVGDSTSGLVKDVADLKSAGYITKDVNDLTNYTTTTAMNTALDGKQNTIDSTHKLSVDLVDGALSTTVAESTYETQTHAAQTYATQADLGNKSNLSSTDFTAAQRADVVTAVNAAMAQAKTASAAKKVTVYTTWNDDTATLPADVLVNAN